MTDYTIPEQVLSRELDGEAVLLDLRSGHYFGLNATAARVWALMKDGEKRDAIVKVITEEFATDEERAAHDVDQFIATLYQRGLLVPASGTD